MRPVIDPTDADLLKQAITEIDRYRSMDRLIPSVHNVVSIATLEVRRFLDVSCLLILLIGVQFHTILGLANLIPYDARILIPLTR